MFKSHGPIISAHVLTHKNSGYVNFERIESAISARTMINGKEIFPGAGPVRINFAPTLSPFDTPRQFPSSNSDLADAMPLDIDAPGQQPSSTSQPGNFPRRNSLEQGQQSVSVDADVNTDQSSDLDKKEDSLAEAAVGLGTSDAIAPMRKRRPRPAFVDDFDEETGKIVRAAGKGNPDATASIRARRSEPVTTGNDDERPERVIRTAPKKEKEKRRPLERDDPAKYGIPPSTVQPIPLRPREVTAQTYPPSPATYHAARPGDEYSRPPLSRSAYYQQPPIYPTPYPPPPPSYMGHLPYLPAPQPNYFPTQTSSRALSARFEPIPGTASSFEPILRPSSASGTRSSDGGPASYFDDAYASADEGTTSRERRKSIRRPPNPNPGAKADSAAMPPPLLRSSILRRSSSSRHSVSYDIDKEGESVRIEPTNSGRRRQIWYDPPSSTPSGYEDKLYKAATYQEDVGGPITPLTAESLRRQQRRVSVSSSKSTSPSRDESDYKRSATTATARTTASDYKADDDENVTIKVTGRSRVMVGGAQIDCDEGGEIEIKHQESLRDGKERSKSEYVGGRLEDRQSRVERSKSEYAGGRLEHRQSRVERPIPRWTTRSGQAGHSYTRSTPRYPDDGYI
jgi:hypothetical protein